MRTEIIVDTGFMGGGGRERGAEVYILYQAPFVGGEGQLGGCVPLDRPRASPGGRDQRSVLTG